ncbi:MAG: LEA type 2 family protein [Bacteroidales bacterium]|nr:LEA type 2 family protein [Bacteroidales bacterium]
MKRRTLPLLLAVSMAAFSMTGCSVLQNVGSQIQSVSNLRNCEYKMKDVSQVSVAGVDVKSITGGNIKATDVLKLAAALTSKKVPLSMNVNVNVTNPTTSPASLTAMDWILEIDGTQFASGTSTQAYNIPASGTTTIPLPVNTDVYSMFSQSGIDALKNFVGSFAGDGTSSKIGIKIKPSISVGGVNIPSPTYINLEKTTGAK